MEENSPKKGKQDHVKAVLTDTSDTQTTISMPM